MFQSLRSRIVFAVIGTIAVAYATTTYLSQRKISQSMLATYMENSKNLVNTVTLNVENQYKSILFHKEKSLEKRKSELENIVTIAFTIINHHYERYLSGEITERTAKKAAIDELRKIRYHDQVGYLWINDLDEPIPKWLMHPTMNHLENFAWDNPEFYIDDNGKKKHLLKAFVEICNENGEGFIEYKWPKPIANGLTEFQPKLSFVRRFDHWGWIVGTGLYLDDIEKDVQDRLNAVIKELETSFSQTKIAETGYMFIFDGDYKSVVHPLFEIGEDVGYETNPVTDERIADGLVNASTEKGKSFSYKWNKPNDPDNFTYQKISFSNYFAPLDWYICSSVYLDEIRKPLLELRAGLIVISVIILVLASTFSIIISNNLARPLDRLTMASQRIEEHGIKHANIPVSGTSETKKLGTVLQQMISSVEHSEAELRKERDFSLHLLKTSPAFITVISSDGKIQMINDAFCNSLKKKSEDLINTNFYDQVISNQNHEEFKSKIQDESLPHFDLNLLTPISINENQTIIVEWYRTSFNVDREQYFICIGIDVTKRKEAETELKKYQEQLEELVETRTGELKKAFADLKVAKEQAESANHAKSEFLANMSHEIRTPLNAILGFSNIMYEEEESHEQRSYLHSIITSGKSLLSLINDILDLSKVEAGQLKIDYSPVSVLGLFREVEIVFQQKAMDNGLDFIIEVPEDFPAIIQIDETRLRQILVNLVGNAIKFTDEGFVKIFATIEYVKNASPTVIIGVADSGIGIPEHEQQRIFGTFTQMEHQDNKKYGGTGLGLAITLRLTEMMNGHITLESYQGEGSTFYVHLNEIEIPETNNDVFPSNQKEVDYSQLSFEPGTILVVDDMEINRQIQKGYLRYFDFKFLEAENGKQAVDLALTHQPDIILMDLKMPVMDGFEAAKRIKEHPETEHIPVIAISASVMSYDQERALENCNIYLKKPLLKQDLLAVLIKFHPHHFENKINTLSQNIDVNKDLGKIKSSELLSVLGTIKGEISTLNESMAFDKIELLGTQVLEIANQYQNKILIEWSHFLIQSSQESNYALTKNALRAILDVLNDD